MAKQNKGDRGKNNKNRGNTYSVDLKIPISLNGNLITKATIELDHINFGLNKQTGELNKKKRSNFNLDDIQRFIGQLDGEDIPAEKYIGDWSIFVVRIDSPIRGKFECREFIMVFKTNYRDSELIHTITLYPG